MAVAALVVGRERELGSITRFLEDATEWPAALLIEGEAGIGKTTLWRAGLEGARRQGFRVLLTRPAEPEATVSFTALSDLFDVALDEVASMLPGPQRGAIEAALLRGSSHARSPDQRAVSLAVLGVLRALANNHPTVIATDDAQWLDPPSIRVLRFAIRRLRAEPIAVMAAVRSGFADPLELAGAFPTPRFHRLEIGPLREAEIRGLLREQRGADFTRPIVRKIHEGSRGNPFYALEIARALIATGSRIDPGQPLPIPKDLRQLLRARLEALTPSTHEVLVAVAASTRPTLELVSAVVGGDAAIAAIEDAENAGVIDVHRAGITFTHPLLGSVAYEAMPAGARRGVHARLAEAVSDPEERARHLALASTRDPRVAGALMEAAGHAARRGALDAAAELAELAVELAPPRVPAGQAHDLNAAAQYAFDAGDAPRARELLEKGLAVVPAGPRRALLLDRIALTRWNNVHFILEHLDAALVEGRGDPNRQSETHHNAAWAWVFGGDLSRAEHHARASLDAAEGLAVGATRGGRRLAPVRRRLARTALALVRSLQGHDVEALLGEASALDSAPPPMESGTVPTVLGTIRTWMGELDEARTVLEREAARFAELGKETLRWELLVLLAEAESRAGNYELAGRHAEEAYDIVVEAGLEDALDEVLFQRALARAFAGRLDEASELAGDGLRIAEAADDRFFAVQNRSVLGFVELSRSDAEAAHRHLGPLHAELVRMGVGEPGAFPLVWDDIDALVALGKANDAEPIVAYLEERAAALDRAWIRGIAARGRALVAAATGELDAALRATEDALRDVQRSAHPFEHARTLLLHGEIHRRAKRKRSARDSLGRALAIFEELGAGRWAERVRGELERVGGAVTGPSGLTPTERRVADLVGQGKTNREVADALFISVKTVEANVSRIFHKLGVRSRVELIRHLAAGNDSET